MAAPTPPPAPAICRNHTLALLAVSLALGICLAPRLTAGPWVFALFAAALALGVVLRCLRRRVRVAACLAFLALGLWSAQVALAPALPPEGRYDVSGYVYGAPTLRTQNRLTFTLCDIALDGAPQPGRAYVTCYTHGNEPLPDLFDGALIRFEGSAYAPQGKSGPHDFDFRLWLLQSGMQLGISVSQPVTVCNTRADAPMRSLAARVNARLERTFREQLGQESGLAMAMLLGQKDGLPDDEMASFRRSGVAHIVAVSGLHVGILSSALLWLLEKLRLRRGWREAVVLLFLGCYCVLTGFSPSTMRAAAMLTLVLVGRALGLRADPVLTLSAAAIVVLLFNPLQLFSASFLLSFSAVGGILLLYPRFRELLTRWLGGRVTWRKARREHRLGRQVAYRVLDLLAVSLAAQLGVLVPSVCIFHQLPLYGLLVNLVVVPLAGLLVPLYALVLLLSPVPGLNVAVSFVAGTLSRLLLWLTGTVSSLPYAMIRAGTPSALAIVAFVALLTLGSRLFPLRLSKRVAAMTLCVIVGSAALIAQQNQPARYVQLSVGRADAALLLCPGQTLAIDVGEYGTEVLAYLDAENRDIDALFLTHLHLDHAGGVPALLDAGVRIGRVYVPYGATQADLAPDVHALLDRLAREGIPVSTLAAGEEVEYNQGTVCALFPIRNQVRAGQDANESSLVLLVTLGGYRILTTADTSDRYEAYFAAECDVLKVAHHGSADSTSDAFLQAVRPRAALVSSAGTAFLPAQSLLTRLEAAGIPAYRTDLDGDLTLTLSGDRLLLTPYLQRSDP